MPMYSLKKSLLLTTLACVGVSTIAIDASARGEGYNDMPSLIITSDDLPESLRKKIYSKPVSVKSIKPSEITGKAYFVDHNETLVTRKVRELQGELQRVQRDVETLSSEFHRLQQTNDGWAAEYYASVATINTQLQSGTTRGNPRLVERLTEAESNLENLADGLISLNNLAARAADIASETNFILEETRAAYGISGAVEEDHVRLSELEDVINTTLVVIDRILNTTSDDITRATTYLSSERSNLRTLALAVSNGDLYGRSLSKRPFSSAAAPFDAAAVPPSAPVAQYASTAPNNVVPRAPAAVLSEPRPLVKIRFDRHDVEYQQPLYAAVSEALSRYPNARFDLVAVQPTSGNAAQVAIESTKARRNAELVLRTLTQMGLPLEQIDLSYTESAQASTNEVHLLVK